MMALDGIRVIDFGRYVSGPYCASLLADFGADVIRIDRLGGSEDRLIGPVTDSGDGAVFLHANRNKRSLSLDARGEQGREVLRRLVLSADIVICNVPATAPGRQQARLWQTLAGDQTRYHPGGTSPPSAIADPGRTVPASTASARRCAARPISRGSGDTPYRTPITWVDHASGVYAAFGAMVALA